MKTSVLKSVKEVTETKVALAKAKHNVSRLERELARAERKLKEAKEEEERANKIKAFLEANKGKRVVIEWYIDNTLFKDRVDNIYFYKDNDNELCIALSGIGVAMPVCLIERIFIEAEI